MPILTDNLQNHHIKGSKYGFSGKRIDQLGSSEYTLVTISADASGSVGPFASRIETAIQEVIRACELSPRADNLLIRLTRFQSKLHEVHGFKPLMECHVDHYKGCIQTGGATALYDATYNAVTAIQQYGQSLSKHHFDVNGIVFVITDGDDNSSTMTMSSVKEALKKSVQEEHLQSMLAVLIGVNVQNNSLSYRLKSFSKNAGFDHYIQLEDANQSSLSSLAAFVSRSIVLQSTALNTGQKTVSLTF